MIKTFEEACEVEGLDPKQEVPFAEPKNADQKALNAFAKLIIIVRVLNDGWVPDFDKNEWKYYPWFYMRSEAAGGSGLSCGDYLSGSSESCVGARLVFKSEELTEYAANQFKDIYEDYMVIPK